LPVFLYGVGAPKSGATWLYEYLRRHPECHLRGHQELHFFDTLERGDVEARVRQLATWIAEREALIGTVPAGERRLRLAEILDMRDFLAVLRQCRQSSDPYFRYLLAGLGSRKLVADITPNYGLLSVPMLQAMAASAPVTRFVYLMRDPVTRLWSQLRMSAEQTLPEGVAFKVHVAALLDRLLAGELPGIRAHSDYAAVLARLDAALPEGALLAMPFEGLTTSEGVRRLCRFLSLRHVAARLDDRVLEGRPADPTPEQMAAMRDFLAPQYAAMTERLGALPAAWQAQGAGDGKDRRVA
jgi:hypothetical protein